MGRPKGSKNKPKVIDANARLAEISQEMESYAGQVVELEALVSQTAQTLAGQRADLRAVTRKVKALEKERDGLQEMAQQQLREAEARELLDAFLASGKSVEDLKELLS